VKKRRLIPVLLLRNGLLVQSRGFKRYQNIGNPTAAVKRLSEWASDEVIYLDISRSDAISLQRDDLGHPSRSSILEILADVAKVTFMPITVGGQISTLQAIEERLKLGADKISINTSAVETPEFIENAAREFGSQCIVVSIDARKLENSYEVFVRGGSVGTGLDPFQWSRRAEALGAGEILINSIDRDGARNGYDLALVGGVAKAVSIPVIACGGVGEWSHFADALRLTDVDGVAAANIFHHSDQSIYHARKYLHDLKLNVRGPALLKLNGA
jgi:imidazole glycerol-phosphate synthase subunit HisF